MAQDNWRWCDKCQGLWFAGHERGSCPGSGLLGGGHSYDGSGNYSLESQSSFSNGQRGWRWCNKCEGMYFAANLLADGSPNHGRCPAGEAHNPNGSGLYAIGSAVGPTSDGTPQSRWSFCQKCQGMFFSGNVLPGGAPALGSCPAGSGHDPSRSGSYVVAAGPTVFPVRVGHLLTWQSFAGQLQDDCDEIGVTMTDTAAPDARFRLSLGPAVSAWKEIKLFAPALGELPLAREDSNRDRPDLELMCPAEDLPGATLVLSKAKFLGVHTGIYQMSSLLPVTGKLVTFTWSRDHCGG
jgi:hypothetical protein